MDHDSIRRVVRRAVADAISKLPGPDFCVMAEHVLAGKNDDCVMMQDAMIGAKAVIEHMKKRPGPLGGKR